MFVITIMMETDMNKFQFDAMLKLFDKVPKPFGRPGQYGVL